MRRIFVRLIAVGLCAAGTILAGCDAPVTTPGKPVTPVAPPSKPAEPGKAKLPVDPG